MGQPSLISEYDLGGEGGLFKASEPIIEEPPLLLSLDPAAISMMFGGDNDSSNVGMFEVLYECEKELMEKSVIEETISKLLDIKISMLQVEEEVPAGELHKSVISGCVNSMDWMNRASSVRVRPNFQALDLGAVPWLRTAYDEGEIHV